MYKIFFKFDFIYYYFFCIKKTKEILFCFISEIVTLVKVSEKQ